MAQGRPAEGYGLADFKSAQVGITPSSVALHDKGFFYQVRVLAVGDLRHLGHGEWLVRFVDGSVTGGPYDTTAMLIVDRAARGGRVATDALDVLRGQVH
jgi:hypothetical protein